MGAVAWVRVALGRSRCAGAAVVLAFTVTAALVAWLPWPAGVRALLVLALGVYAIALVRAWATRSAKHAVIAIAVGIDRRITLTERGGKRVEGMVNVDSYVGAVVTTIVVCVPGRRWPRSIAILPDMLPAEDFRKLRVLLRLGRESSEVNETPLPRGEGQG